MGGGGATPSHLLNILCTHTQGCGEVVGFAWGAWGFGGGCVGGEREGLRGVEVDLSSTPSYNMPVQVGVGQWCVCVVVGGGVERQADLWD